MHASTVDQPQVFKDSILNALERDIEFGNLCDSEPYRNWNVQVTVNFVGGDPRKVEITKLSRKDK